MRVALVHDFLTSYTGAERVLKVIADLYPKAPIFTLLYDQTKVGHVFPPARVRTSFLQHLPRWLRARRRWLLPLFPVATEQLDLSGFDLIISSSNAWVHGVIPRLKTTHLCYCHSPMRFAWDWTHEYQHEQGLRGLKKFLANLCLHRIRLWDAVAAARVDRYAANSQAVQGRIAKYYRQSATVIYPPVDLARFAQLPTKDKGFYLIVSRLEPYKRIDLAIAALRDRPQQELFIVGEGSAERTLRRQAKNLPNIHFSEALPDQEVDRLYANCHAFLFLGEDDFGLTPVEAMACGKPVVALAAGGALETVVAGQTGFFFAQPTVASLRSALDQLEDNYARLDPAACRQRAQQFSLATFQENFQDWVEESLAETSLRVVHLKQSATAPTTLPHATTNQTT